MWYIFTTLWYHSDKLKYLSRENMYRLLNKYLSNIDYKEKNEKSNRTKGQMRINAEFIAYKVQFFKSSYYLNTL